MEIFRDVTSHSMLRFMIFSQPPNSSWTLLVFLPPGKGVLQTGRKTEHRGPWDSSFALKKPSLLLGLTPHSIPIIIPALRLSLFRDPNPHRLLVIPPSLSPICEGSPRPITLVVSWCLSASAIWLFRAGPLLRQSNGVRRLFKLRCERRNKNRISGSGNGTTPYKAGCQRQED